jgi:hypothetical protein
LGKSLGSRCLQIFESVAFRSESDEMNSDTGSAAMFIALIRLCHRVPLSSLVFISLSFGDGAFAPNFQSLGRAFGLCSGLNPLDLVSHTRVVRPEEGSAQKMRPMYFCAMRDETAQQIDLWTVRNSKVSPSGLAPRHGETDPPQKRPYSCKDPRFLILPGQKQNQ